MRLLASALAFLFPPSCVSCGAEGAPLCDTCLTHITRLPLTPCIRIPHITATYSACPYRENPILKKAISSLKYRHMPLWQRLAPLLTPAYQHLLTLTRDPLVTFVPLHPAREKERGFNQSALLAATLTPDASPLLARTRDTPPQARLARAARLTNMQHAFALLPQRDVTHRDIILIDDVTTTGATLAAAAAPLKTAGAAHIYALTLAHG